MNAENCQKILEAIWPGPYKENREQMIKNMRLIEKDPCKGILAGLVSSLQNGVKIESADFHVGVMLGVSVAFGSTENEISRTLSELKKVQEE